MLKEKNIPCAQKLPVLTREQLQPQKLIDNYVTVKIDLPREEPVVIAPRPAPRPARPVDHPTTDDTEKQGAQPGRKKIEKKPKPNQDSIGQTIGGSIVDTPNKVNQ